jgi:hypothetical protein
MRVNEAVLYYIFDNVASNIIWLEDRSFYNMATELIKRMMSKVDN